MVFAFTDADGRQVRYWWGGMHIMAKMRPAPQGTGVFYDETPSWFWTTFEFNGNPGVDHVRAEFITQRAPLTPAEVDALLAEGGIDGIGYKNYSPNGTQIRFTVDGDGADPVRLGHTMMEDFAGHPDPNDPAGWTSFDASCRTCQSTGAITPTPASISPSPCPSAR